MVKIFRSLVILNLALYWVYMFGMSIVGATLGFSDNEFKALSWRGADAAIEGSYFWFYGLLLTYTALSAGLILLQAWARTLFVVVVPIQLLLTLLFGISVLLPWELFLVSLMTYVDGFILCMLLFTSISTSFSSITKRSTTPPKAVAGRS